VARSYVVTGGGRGVGRAIVERLLGDGGVVVAIELDPEALAWTGRHPAVTGCWGWPATPPTRR
jgi:NAD(P)-dependent dehydrogenase (short-subunit alcohol dehydrogenase family)